MSLTVIRANETESARARARKNIMRLEDAVRRVSGESSRAQLRRDVSIAGLSPKPGRILFSTGSSASLRVS